MRARWNQRAHTRMISDGEFRTIISGIMLDSTLMVLHFLGLALGLSTGFANMVMAGLIDKAAPNEKAVLSRFPPAMARVGVIGLALLWISGISIVMTRYGTF